MTVISDMSREYSQKSKYSGEYSHEDYYQREYSPKRLLL